MHSIDRETLCEQNYMFLLKKLIKFFIHIPAKTLSSAIFGYEKVVQVIFPQMAGALRQDLIERIDADIREVRHQGPSKLVEFKLYTPNHICAFRQSTFSSKEPEMLEWIDEYGGEGAFYDIGANIGIYSLYYAKTKPGRVYSFEPSVFNLRQLAKNISVNAMDSRITIISTPLSNTTGIASFLNGNSDEGGALSAFGVEYGQDGNPIKGDIRYSVLGFSLDDLLESGAIDEPPSLIKIDVDGIEHLILSGGIKTLSLEVCKAIFVEVNDDFEAQSVKVKELLETAGFTFKEKRHSDMLEGSKKFGGIYNQIWVR